MIYLTWRYAIAMYQDLKFRDKMQNIVFIAIFLSGFIFSCGFKFLMFLFSKEQTEWKTILNKHNIELPCLFWLVQIGRLCKLNSSYLCGKSWMLKSTQCFLEIFVRCAYFHRLPIKLLYNWVIETNHQNQFNYSTTYFPIGRKCVANWNYKHETRHLHLCLT